MTIEVKVPALPESVTDATVLGWPGRTVTLEAPRPSGNTTVQLLGSDEAVGFEPAGDGLRITMPVSARGDAYAYTFKLTGVE